MRTIKLLLLTVFLTGCSIDIDITTEEKDMRSKPNSTVGDLPFGKVTRFTYDGHDYIKFNTKFGRSEGGVVHDPDCRKCKK